MNDLRFVCRQLFKNPAFTCLAVVMLTLGVAGNATVFALLNAVYLRPLPFPEPGRLVDLDEVAPSWNVTFTGLRYPDFE